MYGSTDSFRKYTFFSTTDANSGLWHVEIDEMDREKTVSTLQHGLYLFTCLLLGHKNALGIFQRTMDVILVAVQWDIALK